MRQIYLDYNATTPVAPTVQQALHPFLTEFYGNPSSSHAMGRACQEAIEDARSQLALLLGADADEIVFTSGGTESNNLAIKGVMWKHGIVGHGHLVVSAIEHPAVIEPARFLERMGYDLTIVPCNSQGVVEPEAVENALRPDTLLVSIMHANNETGVIQPIRKIAAACRSRGVLVHTDASQTVGKIRTNVDDLGVDLLSVAGHKMYAPKGIGALFVRQGVALEPLLHGAGHECGLRAGTENVPYIAAIGRAAALANKGLDDVYERLTRLRDRLYDRLRETIGEQLVVNGGMVDRLPNTLSVNFPRVSGNEMLKNVPELCASTGSACHSGATTMSPTLAAMGVRPQDAKGTIRLSVGWYTSEEDVDRAAELLIDAWERLSR